MANKTVTIPEPTEATDGVLLEVRGGPTLRVTVAYRSDGTTWEDATLPAAVRAKVVAAVKAALAAAKADWGF